MKRLIALALTFILALTMFAGCTGTPKETSPAETTPTETPEEAKVLKIMIIGSSRSVNTFRHLYMAFKDQMPDQELVLGVMYYSGGSMSDHAGFILNNESVLRYYRNTDGLWNYTDDCHMDTGLTDQAWDVVLLQAGSGDLANNMNESARIFLKEYVDSRVTTPHVLWWHTTWFNSTTPSLFDPSKTKLDPAAIDQVAQLTESVEAAKATVFNDPMFAGYICSGTPLMYALNVLDIPDVDLYRDHTHLSDYGCLLVAYAFYAQFTGNAVTEINLDVIEKAYRQPQYQNLGDMEITEEMKQAIIKTVDYTLKNPWTVPTE